MEIVVYISCTFVAIGKSYNGFFRSKDCGSALTIFPILVFNLLINSFLKLVLVDFINHVARYTSTCKII